MLSCNDIHVRYRDGDLATEPLRGLTFDVDRDPVALMGPSGSGKSTLIRVLAGLQQPDSGAVTIDGSPVTFSRRNPVIDARVSVIHQDYRLVDFLTVEENLRLALELRGGPTVGKEADSSTRDTVEEALAAVGLDGCGPRSPRTLSGGQQQRVAIARSLVVGSRVLLADEPTGALDVDSSRAVARVLRDAADRGVLVVVATHDPEVADVMPRRLSLSSSSHAGLGV